MCTAIYQNHKHIKIAGAVLAEGASKKLVTKKKKNHVRVILHPFVQTPPVGRSFWISMWGGIADIIILAIFSVDRFRGFGVLTPPIFPFSICLAGHPYNIVSITMLMLHYGQCCLLSSLLWLLTAHYTYLAVLRYLYTGYQLWWLKCLKQSFTLNKWWYLWNSVIIRNKHYRKEYRPLMFNQMQPSQVADYIVCLTACLAWPNFLMTV